MIITPNFIPIALRQSQASPVLASQSERSIRVRHRGAECFPAVPVGHIPSARTLTCLHSLHSTAQPQSNIRENQLNLVRFTMEGEIFLTVKIPELLIKCWLKYLKIPEMPRAHVGNAMGVQVLNVTCPVSVFAS